MDEPLVGKWNRIRRSGKGKFKRTERRLDLLEWKVELGECLEIVSDFRSEGKAPRGGNLGFSRQCLISPTQP